MYAFYLKNRQILLYHTDIGIDYIYQPDIDTFFFKDVYEIFKIFSDSWGFIDK